MTLPKDPETIPELAAHAHYAASAMAVAYHDDSDEPIPFDSYYETNRELLREISAMADGDDLEHEYDLEDLLENEDLDEVWKVINRMVDADRGELLYRLQLVSPQGPRHGDTQIRLEEKLRRDSSEWTHVEEADLDG